MTPRVTLRPRSRVEVRLPFQAGSGNFDLLKEICGDLTRPRYDRSTRIFTVSRNHAGTVVSGLAARFGRVHVVQYGHARTTCVSECWGANPRTITDCVCGCAGRNHGSGQPLGKEVQAGLSVENELVRSEYLVTPSGISYV